MTSPFAVGRGTPLNTAAPRKDDLAALAPRIPGGAVLRSPFGMGRGLATGGQGGGGGDKLGLGRGFAQLQL